MSLQMPKQIAFALLFVCSFVPRTVFALPPLPARVVELGMENDPLIRAGYLPVTFYDVDPTGVRDSTAAINRAIRDGRDSGLITYVPAGTYTVSDTLFGIERYQLWNCADHFSRPIAGAPTWTTARAGRCERRPHWSVRRAARARSFASPIEAQGSEIRLRRAP